MRAFNRAIALAPEDHAITMVKGQAYLRWKGTADTLAAVMERIPPDWDPGGAATYSRFTALCGAAPLRRRDRHAGPIPERVVAATPRVSTEIPDARAAVRVHRRRANWPGPATPLHARSSRTACDAHPTDPHIRVALGLAYAGLGRTADALREARRAIELAPIAEPPMAPRW